MREFSGFPSRTKYTPIPNVFFSTLLSQINDIAELKVTLHIFWAVYAKQGYPRFVTYEELLADPVLTKGLERIGSPSEMLRRGLELAVDRGSLLYLTVEHDDKFNELYFVNTEANQSTISRIESGELKLGKVALKEHTQILTEKPNVFTLYEQNIGMLSPIIVEELKEAEKVYPASWIEDAFKEAVDLNKRNWRYISRILERWAAEGKIDGKPGRHSKAESDPEEYYRRYGHLLKR